VDGEPRQEIAGCSTVLIERSDLSACGTAERATQVLRHRAEEAHEPFDLRHGPLLRVRLLQLSADQHVLLVTMHHIISDGWSIGVLTRELAEMYSACRDGRAPGLEPLPVQYADYALWQREWLQGEVFDRQLSYWRRQLADAVPEIELPTDRPRPAAQGYRGDNIPVVLDVELAGHLNALARRHGVTLFMVLYAGWSILLSRLSGQEDVLVGTPVANRRVSELESLIGFFVNTLVLRAAVNGETPVREFLSRVRETTLAAFEHQDIPFEQLVELLRPQRSLNRHPVFQVMFVLQNAPRSELQLAGITGTVENVVNDTSKFDLLLSLEERDNEIVGILNYDTDLFDRVTVERWLGSLMVLLAGMTQRDESPIGDLPLLSDGERRQVLELFNTTTVHRRPALIHELFETQAERTPRALALTFNGESLTYSELNHRANQLAHRLRARGIGPDSIVGICLERGSPLVIGLLATLKAGGAYLPLDPNYPAERLQYMLQDAAPSLVLTQESLRTSLSATTAELIALDAQDVELDSPANIPALDIGLTADHLLYVIYTSGSTGRPKGTAMHHGAMANLMEWHRDSFNRSTPARVLQFAALSFDVAFQEIFSTLCTGGALVLLHDSVRRDVPQLVNLLQAQRVDRLFLPPIMLQSLAEHFRTTGIAPTGIREIITAGEQLRISPEIVDLFNQLGTCQLHNHYGPTETHVVTALTLPDHPQSWPALPTIGAPIANTHVYVLDGRCHPAPIGVVGEIYIGGANLARGYLNRPDLTDMRFVRDHLRGHGRLYRTGDLARWRADGTLEYLGRNDDQIKIRGFRVELGEIEAQLTRHERVKEAAVIVRTVGDGEQRLVAYLTVRGNGSPRAAELLAHVKRALPEHMVPSAFVVLQKLPLTPSGKLNRRALPAPAADAYVTRQFQAPQGETEEAIASVWRDLLHSGPVGRHDNFFELGGHSLLVLKVLLKLNKQVACTLNVSDIYKSPTVAELATRIQGTVAEDTSIDLSQEASLSLAIRATREGPRLSPEAVVLTGATGFVGRFLLAELLRQTPATVYCLVRASSDGEALHRVRTALSNWDLLPEDFASRVVAVRADLRLPRLGLGERDYRMLARRADAIYHCGASMNHLETYEMAKVANVDGVRALLQLAAGSRPKVFNYISTLGVFSSATKEEPRVVDERTSIDHERHSRSLGYVASKWVGEKLVLLAQERNIRCNIFRVGLVWADTQRGRYDELQRTYRLLKSALLCGYGIENYRFEMAPTPVDHVARAIVLLSGKHGEGQGIFHVSSCRQPIESLFDRCNEVMGTSLELLPMYDWIGEIKRLHITGRSLPIVPLLAHAFSMSEGTWYAHQESLGVGRIRFACARTQSELEQAGIVAPVLDDELLRTSLVSMFERDEDLRDVSPWAAGPEQFAHRRHGGPGYGEPWGGAR
jgi:amino acid adenylation domain-containing protein/thioester reductase-like protein